jgi:hypothetical protein
MQSVGLFEAVAECDTNEEAVRQVEKATDSEPVKGEELLESEELQRQLSEAKERLKSEPSAIGRAAGRAVLRLQRKIDPPPLIHTVRQVGYTIREPT